MPEARYKELSFFFRALQRDLGGSAEGRISPPFLKGDLGGFLIGGDDENIIGFSQRKSGLNQLQKGYRRSPLNEGKIF